MDVYFDECDVGIKEFAWMRGSHVALGRSIDRAMSAVSKPKEKAEKEKEKAAPAPISTLQTIRPQAIACGVNRDPNAADWFDVERYTIQVQIMITAF
jgi:hypothetical protein